MVASQSKAADRCSVKSGRHAGGGASQLGGGGGGFGDGDLVAAVFIDAGNGSDFRQYAADANKMKNPAASSGVSKAHHANDSIPSPRNVLVRGPDPD
ncbi:hypothetical protein D3C83_07310 [compost metagenome]